MSVISSVPPDLRPRVRPTPRPARPSLPAKPPAVHRPAAPAPPTDAQPAQQQIDPLIKAITDRVNGRATAAQQAISGYGNSLASYLAGINYGAPYQQAIPQQAAVDSALQQSLSGKGNELAQGLSSRLASIQEPGAVDPAVQAVQQFGAGTGNTQLAYGSASLGNLLANQASANEYGLKQPGIAKTATLQGIGKVNAQAVNDIADQTGQLTGKIPDIIAGIQSNRAKQQQLSLENRLANKKYGLDVKKTNSAAARARAATATANASLTERQTHDRATEQAARDRIAAQKAAAAAKAAKAKQPKPPKPLSAADKRAALKAADLYFYGQNPVARADGTVVKDGIPGISYAQAVRQLMVGYGLTRAQAVQLANTYYKVPGERGRPRSAAQKKTQAAVDSGLGIPTVPAFGPSPFGPS